MYQLLGTDVLTIQRKRVPPVVILSFHSLSSLPLRITLFDSPEDDEFDGDMGVDDDEIPRALMGFLLTSRNTTTPKGDASPVRSVPAKATEPPQHSNHDSSPHSSPSNVQNASSTNEEEAFQNLNNERTRGPSVPAKIYETDRDQQEETQEHKTFESLIRDVKLSPSKYQTPDNNKVMSSPSSEFSLRFE